jgi:hypothetical protein
MDCSVNRGMGVSVLAVAPIAIVAPVNSSIALTGNVSFSSSSALRCPICNGRDRSERLPPCRMSVEFQWRRIRLDCAYTWHRHTNSRPRGITPATNVFGRNNQCIGALYLYEVQITNMEVSMSRARILALSFVAALALSSGALAQGGGAGGGGGGGGAGGAGSGAGGASGASGTTGNSGGSRSGPSGAGAAQPSGRTGQSGPSGNSAAQPPGSTGQNSINSPGTGVGPGSTPNAPSGTSGSSGQR